MNTLRNLALLVGRILIAGVFIYDATLMVRFHEANVSFMEQFGVPGILLWPTAAFQFVGGLMIVAGFWTRLVALGFAGFCLATALIFHRDFADTTTLIQFGKDAALAGGFLFLFAAGAGRWSIDGRRAETI
jgi:putative oxidoreductase